jgi:hypothetical protein
MVTTSSKRGHDSAPGAKVALNDLFVEPPMDAAGIDLHLKPGVQDEITHQDHGHHELSESAAESISRLLIRLVPCVYGGLLGYLGGVLVPGLIVGILASLVFDLAMGRHSLLRRLRCCLPRTLAPGFRPR